MVQAYDVFDESTVIQTTILLDIWGLCHNLDMQNAFVILGMELDHMHLIRTLKEYSCGKFIYWGNSKFFTQGSVNLTKLTTQHDPLTTHAMCVF